MWFLANLGPVLLSHEYILYMPRMELSPMFSGSKVPSFNNGEPLIPIYSGKMDQMRDIGGPEGGGGRCGGVGWG